MALETAFTMNAEAAAVDTPFLQESTIYVGVAGDVVVVPWVSGGNVTFKVPAGGVVPCRVRQVVSAGTTASALVRLW